MTQSEVLTKVIEKDIAKVFKVTRTNKPHASLRANLKERYPLTIFSAQITSTKQIDCEHEVTPNYKDNSPAPLYCTTHHQLRLSGNCLYCEVV